MPTTSRTAEPRPAVGGRLVAADGRLLPLTGVRLRAEAGGGHARAALEQRFTNPYGEPLQVTYQVPLPADGAVAGYAVRVGDRRVTGEIDRCTTARERFEDAILEGRTAALIRQERSNLFTQEIGNIPPGVEVVAELSVDQPLAWLAEGWWEWRWPTVVAPRYLGAEGRVADSGAVTVAVTESGVPVPVHVELDLRDGLSAATRPVSPSHTIAVTPGTPGAHVAFDGPVRLDRDLVVRWRAAGDALATALDVARAPAGSALVHDAYGLLTVVPPLAGRGPRAISRDLIVLIDTSGSMAGEPLAQARAVARGLVDTLEANDRLEMISFSDRPRRWRRTPAAISDATRADAVAWLDALDAGGGTEMRDGIVEALRPLRPDAQRQTVLVSDGLVGFEDDIVATIMQQLPPNSRLHTVGIGSAVNRGLTAPAARAGRGLEVLVDLDEDPRPHVDRLVARMRTPVLTGIEISGSAVLAHAPAAPPDVYAGSPLRMALKLRPEGGRVRVQGETADGPWESVVSVAPVEPGAGRPAVVTLYGREAVEDLEVRHAAGVEAVDRDVEALGLTFRIATRLTSWVAVSEEPAVDPRAPIRRETIPQGVPSGVSIEALGLRRPMHVGMAPDAMIATPLLALRSAPPRRGFLELLARQFSADPPGATSLAGRLAARRGRVLTFEIPLTAPMDWDPAAFAEVSVVWAGGTPFVAEIVAELTTAAGPLAPGLIVRLGVRLAVDGPAGAPERVVLDAPPLRLEIRVA
jgi:Ca-activated chloride channel family protein